MINWTITPNVEPKGVPAGTKFWEVNGVGADPDAPHQDPHDARYYPDQLGCLHFLIGMKMKMGDTMRVAGADTGRILRVNLVKIGDKFEYDVETRQLANPEELIEWLDMQLRPGDTVAYLDSSESK